LLRLFREFVSPEQMEFAAKVEKMGGIDAVQNNEQLMRELANKEPSMRIHTGEEYTPVARSVLRSDNRHGTDRSFNFIELKREIERNPDEAIAKNLECFNDKLDLQKRHIEEATEHIVTREGDRVIMDVIIDRV